ncbi:esterase/lipase family protein [Leifsonia sp. NPDC058248]|uniref:esterase/lipase family protein n=1 Tax=Leifsonia sp. NPDC058248 TaxID=3346402 RepID=UPI0036D9FE50
MTLFQKAGVWLADYVYAGRHQVRAALDRTHPDALVAASGMLAPVVLLPGIFETWRFLQPLATHVHALGHPVHVVTALGLNHLSIGEGSAIVAAYLERRMLTDVTLIAHSKGGLIAKHAMGVPGAAERIRRTIAVSTPFSGSSYAQFFPLRSVRTLAPTDPELSRLSLDHEVNARIVSVYGWFDPHIPGGCELVGAQNVRLDVGGHFRLLGRRELFDVVDRVLAQDEDRVIQS